jgi:hypothetical protein
MSDDNPTGKAVSHFRKVKVVRKDSKNRRPVVNIGGGAYVEPKTPRGVPVYLHDYYGQGRHARVVLTNARDFSADGLAYKSEIPLTGDKSRVAEVKDVKFPTLLEPVDDLPPATVITRARRQGNKVIVRGSASDNGTVKRVLVNGKEARSTAGNFGEWEVELAGGPKGELKVEAHAEDSSGNVEKVPHAVVVR